MSCARGANSRRADQLFTRIIYLCKLVEIRTIAAFRQLRLSRPEEWFCKEKKKAAARPFIKVRSVALSPDLSMAGSGRRPPHSYLSAEWRFCVPSLDGTAPAFCR
ncbi:hypothetical protein AD997_15795 [Erwinia amylovora]|nr:hypothetical protein AD997_15795 [Erwinia amylovora]